MRKWDKTVVKDFTHYCWYQVEEDTKWLS